MEPEGSLPHSQVPATCPHPEPDRSCPFPHTPLPEDPSWYYPPIYAWVFQVVSFPQVSPPKPYIHLCSPHTCYLPRPPHSSRFDRPNNIGRGVQIPFLGDNVLRVPRGSWLPVWWISHAQGHDKHLGYIQFISLLLILELRMVCFVWAVA